MSLGKKDCTICPFRDSHRSIPHLDQKTGKVINPNSNAFCTIVNDWVSKDTSCEAESVLKSDRHSLVCGNCGVIVAYVSVDKNGDMFDFVYTENLDSRRMRGDGLIGLECNNCGESTLLSDDKKDNQAKEQYLKSMDRNVASILKGKEREVFIKALDESRVTTKEQADWKSISSKFLIKKG